MALLSISRQRCGHNISHFTSMRCHTPLRRYWTANSSEDEFNVDALLKTTTGMTMEDLRHNMANLRSTRRKRALGASLDLVLSQFPSDDHVRSLRSNDHVTRSSYNRLCRLFSSLNHSRTNRNSNRNKHTTIIYDNRD